MQMMSKNDVVYGLSKKNENCEKLVDNWTIKQWYMLSLQKFMEKIDIKSIMSPKKASKIESKSNFIKYSFTSNKIQCKNQICRWIMDTLMFCICLIIGTITELSQTAGFGNLFITYGSWIIIYRYATCTS
eukprot:UN07304